MRSQGLTDDANKCKIVSARFAHFLLRRIDGDRRGTTEQNRADPDQTPCGDSGTVYNQPDNKTCQQTRNHQASVNTRRQTEIGCCHKRAKAND